MFNVHSHNSSDQKFYFVTLYTENKENTFGEMIDGKMHLNLKGEIVRMCWFGVPEHFSQVQLDAFVVLPNRMLGILKLKNIAESELPLNTVIHYFQSATTCEINNVRNSPGEHVWQRTYHQEVIHDESALNQFRNDIFSNPSG